MLYRRSISVLIRTTLMVVVLVVSSLAFAKEARAQVIVINEVFPNPVGEESGAEWVELYNKDQEVAPLGGCTLYLDDTTTSQKVVFSTEDFVEKFRVISWSGTWLRNDGDQVRIECSSSSDQVSYGDQVGAAVGKPDEGQTVGRFPDGTGSFYILTATINSQNSSPPTPTPSPTPTATPTSSPTPTPTATPKPTPTKTPTAQAYTDEDSGCRSKSGG